ncbi:bifunctional hydroxymethylpyrimidine kinase/phosphomethylpyrimidine kinase [Rugosimonospora acidiphila]|uniref:Bifunctional hydroxymethylpyrimidine kinase/phosphomethylpyrimidine kinase n=1 Tax=Rugosimonospora acidiphila TaxID=556531 RepID=A0ABP9SN64_9ACTN
MVANLLTIAGSDPSGGAGIQADLKAFAALGTYGMSVVTGLTAQNTRGVRGIHPVPARFVADQLEAVLDDVRVDAVKIGMLGTAEVVRAVAEVLAARRPPYVVLDPVMVAKSGDRLLAANAVRELRGALLPVVDLITPNLPEAADLLGVPEAADEAQMREQLASLMRLGPAVLLKGGHLTGPECPDLLALDASGEPVRLTAPRVATRNTHGTGCTLSSAIAALRPQRGGWAEAVADAKRYLTAALAAADGLDVGSGHGPVHHFHEWWK